MQAQSSASGSATMVMELPPYPPNKTGIPVVSSTRASMYEQPNATSKDSIPPSELPDNDILPLPTTATPQLARWNRPRINTFRVLATFYSFIMLGANDGAYGALIPYLEQYYSLSYTVVSLVFLSPVIGYTAAAITINLLHNKVGHRGIAIVMSLSHTIAYLAICLHPPYPLLVFIFVLAGYGNGLGDSAWNAWLGGMANANEVLGFLHGFYGLGAALSPLVATALITKAGWQWYEFYYFMLGAAVLEVILLTSTFWSATGNVFRAEHLQTADNVDDQDVSAPSYRAANTSVTDAHKSPSRFTRKTPWYVVYNAFKNPRSRIVQAIKNRVTITAAIFLLVYVGAEVSIGGWIVTFMLRVRGGTPFASGLISTGFWLGITVGRFVLGFITPRLFKTEKHAVAVYLVVCLVLQLMFWLIPQFVVSAVMVGLLGFFLAPLFPVTMVIMTKLLPKHLHVSSVGFAAAVGASGACILPFAVGAIANARGVQVLQPIILAFLAVDLGIWLLIPRVSKQSVA